MTKKDIAKSIAARAGIPRGQALSIIQSVFDSIIETLVSQDRIELRNFVVFEVRKRKARKARNPRTGEVVAVPEHLAISFKAGLEMQERVEQSGHPFQRQAFQCTGSRRSQ
jgi:nucleoid DNA-binding protein